MDIVILACFAGRLDGGGNNRFCYLASEMSKNHSVEIITSDFNHADKSNFNETYEYPFSVTLLHEAGYTKNVSIKRFASHFIWGLNVKKYLEKRKKPDVIYCAVPTLTASYMAARFCKENNIRMIIDIQDLWPEAYKMVFNVPIISDIIFAPFSWLSNKIYAQADEIIAVSDTYAERAMKVNQKCKESHTVFLGTKLQDFDNNVKENQKELEKTGLWLGYCGTLGKSYDLTCVFDALAYLKEKGIEVPKFIVMGKGARKEEFEKYAAQKNIDAVFTGNLPYPEMCARLSACDIVVNPIVAGSAGSIINKHADYAASGAPVINSQQSQEYRELVDAYQMGLNCKNGDASDMADKLQHILQDINLRETMGRNARICAEEKFDRGKTYREIVNVIESQ